MCIKLVDFKLSEILNIFAGSLYIISAIVAIVGNATSLFILRKIPMRYSSKKSMYSVVVSDLLIGMVSLPLFALLCFSKTLSEICTLKIIVIMTGKYLIGVSLGFLAMVAYDRYIILTKTRSRFEHVGCRKTKILMYIVWLDQIICLVAFEKRRFNILFIIFFVRDIIVCVIIALCYTLIMKFMRNQRKQSFSGNDAVEIGPKLTRTRRTISHQVKLGKQVIVLINCCFICVIPVLITTLYPLSKNDGGDGGRPRKIHSSSLSFTAITLFTWWLALLNSSINPFIYLKKYPQFRMTFQRIFHRGRPRRKGVKQDGMN